MHGWGLLAWWGGGRVVSPAWLGNDDALQCRTQLGLEDAVHVCSWPGCLYVCSWLPALRMQLAACFVYVAGQAACFAYSAGQAACFVWGCAGRD